MFSSRTLVSLTLLVVLFGPLKSVFAEAEAELITEKDQITFEPDIVRAESKVAEYDGAIETAKLDVDAHHRVTDLEYGKKYYQEINGLPMFSLLGGPAYTPEQGMLLAIGGLYSFKTDRYQTELQRSSVSAFIVGNYVDSQVGYGVRAKHNLYWDDNNISFKGEWNAGVQSKHYWGVGYDAAERDEQGDDTRYTAMTNNYSGALLKRIAGQWFAGLLLDINYIKITDEPSPLVQDENYAAYGDVNFTWAPGLSLKYDSRDVEVNAWSGSLFNTEIFVFSDSLGSQLTYQKLDIDYRTYHSVAEGKVIALLANYQQAFGDVPFFDMPEIGGNASMRGLYQGQYRDTSLLELTTEYRHTFSRSNGALSSHGMTVWAGLGAVAEKIGQLTEQGVISYGLGYRYELQPRMNLRLDLGMSKHGPAFYFNFTEAF